MPSCGTSLEDALVITHRLLSLNPGWNFPAGSTADGDTPLTHDVERDFQYLGLALWVLNFAVRSAH